MKSNIKRAIAVLLILTVALLTACSVTMDAVKAAEIGGDSDVDLSSYGEFRNTVCKEHISRRQ